MPELPEVETITRYLRDGNAGLPGVLGRTILAADVLWERTIAEPGALEFIRRVSGQVVETVGRRAKYLVLRLTSDTLLVHLRMSGDLRVELEGGEGGAHDRVVFHLEGRLRLVFNDARKFGRMWLVNEPESVLGRLGPEPLGADFSAGAFFDLLRGHQRRLKPLLLDQCFLAGLGNIYTDESLHRAGLHPNRLASSLSPVEAQQLWAAIRLVLNEGIRNHGASIDWVYRGGDFQNTFRVYQRTGLPCPVCGTLIERRVVGQRGTHYCPVCQPEPG